MPAKTSPEAAQKKVWKAELTSIARNRKKILADASKAEKQATKDFAAAGRKYKSAIARIKREVPKALKDIDRRIAILEGRIGI